MNLLKLQILVLLYKHKKVTAVAAELNLKQPTVSFHMKSLEQELGVTLFQTRTGKTVFTEAGKALYSYAVQINALTNEAIRVVQNFHTLERGSLVIGASLVPGTYLLPRLIGEMRKQFSGLTITLIVKKAAEIREILQNHEIDFAVLDSGSFENEEMVVDTLCTDELVLIYPTSGVFEGDTDITPEQVASQLFIHHGAGSHIRSLTEQWLESNGTRLRNSLSLDSPEGIKEAVISGSAISIFSKMGITRELEKGELLCRPIPNFESERSIYIAYHKDRIITDGIRSFIQMMKAAMKPG